MASVVTVIAAVLLSTGTAVPFTVMLFIVLTCAPSSMETSFVLSAADIKPLDVTVARVLSHLTLNPSSNDHASELQVIVLRYSL